MGQVSGAELHRMEQISHIGDKLHDFSTNGSLSTLEEYVLEPLDKAAFETFKKVDPDKIPQIIQAQMMSKVIDEIRQTINKKIEEGRLMAETIRTLPDMLEDE